MDLPYAKSEEGFPDELDCFKTTIFNLKVTQESGLSIITMQAEDDFISNQLFAACYTIKRYRRNKLFFVGKKGRKIKCCGSLRRYGGRKPRILVSDDDSQKEPLC